VTRHVDRQRDLIAVGRALGDMARWDQPLGALTTYRVGGRAALAVEPENEVQLLEVAEALQGRAVPVVVLGRGSNLLVSDQGFHGLVVVVRRGFDEVVIDGTQVEAGSSVSLPVLARRTAAAGLSGLEWAVGVPGSVGGAVCMNAGGHGSDTATTLLRYRSVDLASGTVVDSPAAALDARYRTTSLRSTDVVVGAVHRLRPGDPEQSADVIAGIVRWRREHQPGGSNAGSVFVNPADTSAGSLIDQAGLRGFRIGSAEVSSKHANFIQADEGGSADDVVAVMEHVRSVVAARTGVELRTEIRMLGFGEPGTARW